MGSPYGSSKARLLRQALAVARLHHPNLARLLPMPGGAGFVPIGEGAPRLSDVAGAETPFLHFELERAVWLLIDVLGALRVLHELVFEGRQFVHGAVSPSHILVGEPGASRLVPLVNAHLLPDAAIDMSGYAAPEVLRAAYVDHRADLFSVGALLWEALTRRRLNPETSLERAVARAEQPFARPVLSPGAEWAEPLCEIAARCLAPDPEQRFMNALAVSDAIVGAVGPRLTLPPAPRGSPWLRTLTPPATVIDLPVPDDDSDVQPTIPRNERPEPPLSEEPVSPWDEGRKPRWGHTVPRAAWLAALLATLLGGAVTARRSAQEAARPANALASASTTSAPPPAPASPLATSSATAPSASAASSTATPPRGQAAPRRRRPKSALPAADDYGI